MFHLLLLEFILYFDLLLLFTLSHYFNFHFNKENARGALLPLPCRGKGALFGLRSYLRDQRLVLVLFLPYFQTDAHAMAHNGIGSLLSLVHELALLYSFHLGPYLRRRSSIYLSKQNILTDRPMFSAAVAVALFFIQL
jgi:hypothetical protein